MNNKASIQNQDNLVGQLPQTIPEWLGEVAKIYGQALAISSVEQGLSLSYQELYKHIQNISNQLRLLGLKPGDIVIIALENGADFLTSILSTATVATAFPLNPHQPETEFSRYFDLLDIKAVVTRNNFNSTIVKVARSANIPVLELNSDSTTPAGQFSLSTTQTLTEQDKSKKAVEPQLPQLSDYAVLVATSGSTGQPKIISLTHESFFVSINHAADWMQLTSSDRSLVITPFAMLHALVRSSCPLLLRGGEVVCTPGYNPAKILDWLEQKQPSFFTGVPSMYRSILESIRNYGWTPQLTSLRFLVTGSDKIEAAEIKAVETALNVPLIQFYGMSEVSPLPVTRPLPPIETPSGAVGKINPMWKVACVDETGKHLSWEQEGEIILHGGYINRLVGINSSQTNSNVNQDWFYTGDLGYLDRDGFLYYTGRVDNRINRGGTKIYAGELESVLQSHPAIKQTAVFGIPDNLYGECIGAVVVLQAGELATPKTIRQFMVERVSESKIPDLILIKDSLPLNPFGKIKRKTLAAHFALQDIFDQKKSHFSSISNDGNRPKTALEQKLSAIWLDVLGLTQVGLEDDFFELGGHSLLALKLFAAIEEQFGRKLPANALLKNPTIQQLAQLLSQSALVDAQPWSCLVQLKSGGDQPALFLVHDADGDILLYRNLARHLDPKRPVYGLRPYGREGFPILDWNIEQIVNRYIENILAVQPQGPYCIGGLCDGGIYSYEIGQQLQARGHQVGFIALLDAIDYEAVRYPESENVKKVKNRLRHKVYSYLLARGWQLPSFFKDKISVRMMLRLGKEGYIPQSFPGRLLLFRATATNYPMSETPQYVKIADPFFGWQKRATKGVEVYDILDTHSGMLREPSVKLLANQIEAAFENI